jgi:DNA-binding LacI/PurR family transcriptional regulator
MSWVFDDPYMREFLSGVAQVCEEKGVGLSLVAGDGDKGAWGIRSAVVDGLILSTLEQAEFIEPAMRRKLRLVVMDVDAGADVSSVRIDERGAARQLTRHLVELGHRRFAVASIARRDVAPILHLPNGGARQLVAAYEGDRERVAGIADALAEVGLSIDDAPMVEGCGSEREQKLYGIGGASLLFDNAPDVTAIIALCAPLALTALAEAHRRGIQVPERMSIAGFDDPPEAALANPPLTTIAQPVLEKGRRAASILFETGPSRHVVLPVELKIRSSTASAPS